MPPCTCGGNTDSKSTSKAKSAFWEAIIKKQEEKLDRLRAQKYEICSRIKELQAKCSPTFFNTQLKAIDAACSSQDKKASKSGCQCSEESSESSESNACRCTPDPPKSELSLCCSCNSSVESVAANCCNCENFTTNPYQEKREQYQSSVPQSNNCICTISEIKSSFNTFLAKGAKTPPEIRTDPNSCSCTPTPSDLTSCTCTITPEQKISDNKISNQKDQYNAQDQKDESGMPCICGLCDLIIPNFPTIDATKKTSGTAEELFTAKNFNRQSSNKKSSSKAKDTSKAYCCSCDKTVSKPPPDVGDVPFKNTSVGKRQMSTSARPISRDSAKGKRKSAKKKNKSLKLCCFCGADLPPMEPNITNEAICNCGNTRNTTPARLQCLCDSNNLQQTYKSDKICDCCPTQCQNNVNEPKVADFEKSIIEAVCKCDLEIVDTHDVEIEEKPSMSEKSCTCEPISPPVAKEVDDFDGSCDCDITTIEKTPIGDVNSSCSCAIEAVDQDVVSDATCSCVSPSNKPIGDVDSSCSCADNNMGQENDLTDGTCSCGSLPANQETTLQNKPVGDGDSSCSCADNNVVQENGLSDGSCSCGSFTANKNEALKQGQDDVSSFVSCLCDLPQLEENSQRQAQLQEQVGNKRIDEKMKCSCGTQMKIRPSTNKKEFSNKSTCIKICINSFTQTDETAPKGRNPVAFKDSNLELENCKCGVGNWAQTKYEKEKEVGIQSCACSSSSSDEESSGESSMTSQSTTKCSCVSKSNNSVSQERARFISCTCSTVASTYVAALGLCGFNSEQKNKGSKTQKNQQFCSCSLDESEDISDDEQCTCVAIAIHSCNETPFKRSKNQAVSTKTNVCSEKKGLTNSQRSNQSASKHLDTKTLSCHTTDSKKTDSLSICASKSTPSMGFIRKQKESKILCKNVSDIMTLAEDFKIFPNISSETFTLSGSRNALSAIELSHDYAIPKMYVAVARTQNCFPQSQKNCNQGCCVCLTLDSPSEMKNFHTNASNIPLLSSFCFDSPLRRGTVDSGCSPIENMPFSKYCQTKHSSLRRHSSKSRKKKPTVSYAQTDSRCSVCSCSLREAIGKDLEDYGIVEDVPIKDCYHERKHKRKCVSSVTKQDSICDESEKCSKKVMKRKYPTQDISRNRPSGNDSKSSWYNQYDWKNRWMPSQTIDQELDNYPTKLDKILNIFGDISKDIMDPSDSTASISILF
nr:balbiani ring protein 3-like [Onthophagus taurus]